MPTTLLSPAHAPTVMCSTVEAVRWVPAADFAAPQGPQVFRFEVAQFLPHLAYLTSLLPPAEVQRGQQYFQEAHCQKHRITRAVVRLVLGKITQASPWEIIFAAGVNNKPILADSQNLHFTISYANSLVLLAVHSSSVGIDVEDADPAFAYHELLNTSFSPEEAHYITHSPAPAAAFFRLWTRKEALAKATGQGIDQNFAQLSALDGIHGLRPGLLASAQSWQVLSFPAAPHCSASLAYVAIGASQLPVFYELDERLLG